MSCMVHKSLHDRQHFSYKILIVAQKSVFLSQKGALSYSATKNGNYTQISLSVKLKHNHRIYCRPLLGPQSSAVSFNKNIFIRNGSKQHPFRGCKQAKYFFQKMCPNKAHPYPQCLEQALRPENNGYSDAKQVHFLVYPFPKSLLLSVY